MSILFKNKKHFLNSFEYNDELSWIICAEIFPNRTPHTGTGFRQLPLLMQGFSKYDLKWLKDPNFE